MILGDVPVFTDALVAHLTSNRISTLLVTDVAGSIVASKKLGLDGVTVGGIVNLLPLRPEYMAHGIGCPSQLTATVFRIVQSFEDDLKLSAKRGGGWLINLTSIDGAFGQHPNWNPGISQAGTVGLIKAISREWPMLQVKNIDLDPAMVQSGDSGRELDLLLLALANEIDSDDQTIEVCLSTRKRQVVRTISQNVTAVGERLSLSRDSVILVIGGGRGVTANVSIRLAEKYPCQYLVVGRTPFSENEADETVSLSSEIELRKHFVSRAAQDRVTCSPRNITSHVEGIIKQRSIRRTLAAMNSHGAQVIYRSVDVSDREQFGKWIDDVYREYGRIDGVILGAGIIEDKRIRDKTLDSFKRVFETKVNPALVMAEKLKLEALQFLVFFSSVAGRFGSPGQVDYSAANEFLNKMAIALSRKCPRAISICWGPWNGGMVSDEHLRLFTSHGVDAIGIEEGVNAFMSELHAARSHGPEVVWGRSLSAIESMNFMRGSN